MRGRRHIKEPPRFMSVAVACQQLIEGFKLMKEAAQDEDADDSTKILAQRLETSGLSESSIGIAVCRLGHPSAKIATDSLAGFMSEVPSVELGGPLHSLVIAAPSLHPIEAQMLASAYDLSAGASASINKWLDAS